MKFPADSGQQEKVFDPFFTTKADEIDIGLSISKSIIESHNGKLWAEDNDGSGVTFYFTLSQGRQNDGD